MAQKKITDLTLRADFDGTCNIPVDDAIQTYRTTGAQLLEWVRALTSSSDEITNLALVPSVAAGALTVAFKTLSGGNPSTSDPISIGMRSATLTSGTYNRRSITAALSVVLSSGSTLGQVSAQPALIYVYAIDNAGTLEGALSHMYYPENALVTTVAEGGAGAADSATAIYSSVARTNVPIRMVGTILNTQTTAGTWASAGTQVQLRAKDTYKDPTITKFTTVGTGTYYPPAGVKKLRVRMVGAGGGGAGLNAGVAGGATLFGTGLLSAGGGGGAVYNTLGPAGGTPSLGAAIGTAIYGTRGQSTPTAGSATSLGGGGGNAPFFNGGGIGSHGANTAEAGLANTGGGGGGSGGASGANPSVGGASGAFIEAWLSGSLLLASYPITIPDGGIGGTSGGNVGTGGKGGSGYIEILEEY